LSPLQCVQVHFSPACFACLLAYPSACLPADQPACFSATRFPACFVCLLHLPSSSPTSLPACPLTSLAASLLARCPACLPASFPVSPASFVCPHHRFPTPVPVYNKYHTLPHPQCMCLHLG
ncbi:hypothetical protein AAFF_G00040090, partial [Aldrovandia affinis]